MNRRLPVVAIDNIRSVERPDEPNDSVVMPLIVENEVDLFQDTPLDKSNRIFHKMNHHRRQQQRQQQKSSVAAWCAAESTDATYTSEQNILYETPKVAPETAAVKAMTDNSNGRDDSGGDDSGGSIRNGINIHGISGDKDSCSNRKSAAKEKVGCGKDYSLLGGQQYIANTSPSRAASPPFTKLQKVIVITPDSARAVAAKSVSSSSAIATTLDEYNYATAQKSAKSSTSSLANDNEDTRNGDNEHDGISFDKEGKRSSSYHTHHSDSAMFASNKALALGASSESNDTLNNGKGVSSVHHRPRKRAKRGPKDVFAPKRASSPYVMFANDIRSNILSEFPGIKFVEMGRVMGERWHALAPEVKKRYKEMAEKGKMRFQREMQQYTARQAAATTWCSDSISTSLSAPQKAAQSTATQSKGGKSMTRGDMSLESEVGSAKHEKRSYSYKRYRSTIMADVMSCIQRYDICSPPAIHELLRERRKEWLSRCHADGCLINFEEFNEIWMNATREVLNIANKNEDEKIEMNVATNGSCSPERRELNKSVATLVEDASDDENENMMSTAGYLHPSPEESWMEPMGDAVLRFKDSRLSKTASRQAVDRRLKNDNLSKHERCKEVEVQELVRLSESPPEDLPGAEKSFVTSNTGTQAAYKSLKNNGVGNCEEVKAQELVRLSGSIPKCLPGAEKPIVTSQSFEREFVGVFKEKFRSDLSLDWFGFSAGASDTGSDKFSLHVTVLGTKKVVRLCHQEMKSWIECKIMQHNLDALLMDKTSYLLYLELDSASHWGMTLRECAMSGRSGGDCVGGLLVDSWKEKNELEMTVGGEALACGAAVLEVDGVTCSDVNQFREVAQSSRNSKKKVPLVLCVSRHANLSSFDLSKCQVSRLTTYHGFNGASRGGCSKVQREVGLARDQVQDAKRGQMEGHESDAAEKPEEDEVELEKGVLDCGRRREEKVSAKAACKRVNEEENGRKQGAFQEDHMQAKSEECAGHSKHEANNLSGKKSEDEDVHLQQWRRCTETERDQEHWMSRSAKATCKSAFGDKEEEAAEHHSCGKQGKRWNGDHVLAHKEEDSRCKEAEDKEEGPRHERDVTSVIDKESTRSKKRTTRKQMLGHRNASNHTGEIECHLSKEPAGEGKSTKEANCHARNEGPLPKRTESNDTKHRQKRRRKDAKDGPCERAEKNTSKVVGGVEGCATMGLNEMRPTEAKDSSNKENSTSVIKAPCVNRRHADHTKASERRSTSPIVRKATTKSAAATDNITMHAVRSGTCNEVTRLLKKRVANGDAAFMSGLQNELHSIKDKLDCVGYGPIRDLSLKEKAIKIYLNAQYQISAARNLENWHRYEIKVEQICNIHLTDKGLRVGVNEISGNVSNNQEVLGPLPRHPISDLIEYKLAPRFYMNNNPGITEHRYLAINLKDEKGERLGTVNIGMNEIERSCHLNKGMVSRAVKVVSDGLLESATVMFRIRRVDLKPDYLNNKRQQGAAKIREIVNWMRLFNDSRGFNDEKLTCHIHGDGDVSLLHAAIYFSDQRAVEELLKLGADSRVQSCVGSAIGLAAKLLGKAKDEKSKKCFNHIMKMLTEEKP